MLYFIFIIIVTPISVLSQTVTPSTQICQCSNLLNQADCSALSGCTWTPATETFMNNTTNIGSCGTSKKPTIISIKTYCGSILNSTKCANTIGCAFSNQTCTIFPGCTPYVQNTNAACQAISIQCTTDGIISIPIGPRANYRTQLICLGNIATSGAKVCKWTGICRDLTCQEAPKAYTTLTQCQNWIPGCLSTGIGCVTTLGQCSSYKKTQICQNLIGSDGQCIIDTKKGSIACKVIQQCSGAVNIITTNAGCDSQKAGCVTNGRACVATLGACNSYSSNFGCQGLIGNDGNCTIDITKTCRAINCTDAANTLSTDSSCNTFLKGCVTTGYGCIAQREDCSTYKGTQAQCANYIGNDGNCKGTSIKTQCQAIFCTESPSIYNTDNECATFKNGCVTNGFGCVSQLETCSSYTLSDATCSRYKGTDGNCKDSNISEHKCVAVSCADASQTYTTNLQCQQFSYLCVTNGAGCILPGACETRSSILSCQGSEICNSGITCLDRSSCTNYDTQSLCLLNFQQYLPAGTKIYYLRECSWNGSGCNNKLCTDLPNTLNTDTQCTVQLAGCVTNGAGCVDVQATCQEYYGIQSDCQNFKGSNGTQLCTQLNSVSNQINCIERVCSNAAIASGVTQTSTCTCTSYLIGCNYDGNGGCTNQDCTTYFGTQTICLAIQTAVNESGIAQNCWQLASVSGTTTACTVKQCTDALISNNSDALCQSFLSGCVTNGEKCISNSSLCTAYQGNLSTCSQFNENINHQCSKTQNICRSKSCDDTITNPSATNCSGYLSSCIYMGLGCEPKLAVCSSYTPKSGSELSQCSNVSNLSGAGCTYSTGSSCTEKTCADSISSPNISACGAYLSLCTFIGFSCTSIGTCASYTPTIGSEAAQCGALVNSSNGKCGWASGANCKNRVCGDILVSPSVANCSAYISSCTFVGSVCVVTGACNTYTPTAGSELTQCLAISNSSRFGCTWDGLATTCTEKTCVDSISSPSAATCSAYLSSCSFIGTGCLASAACTTYSPTVGSEASQCAAFTNASGVPCKFSSGTACSERACTDTIASPSAATCTAYLSNCGFNGSSCVVASLCTSYGPPTACNLTTDGAGNFCGFQLNASNCSAKACTDVISNPSAASCSYYLTGCLYNGTNCITPGNCNTYIAQGQNDSAKASFCNVLTGATTTIKCTFLSGSSNCLNTSTCNTYNLASLENCALTQDSSGNLCGFNIGDGNCSARKCSQQLSESQCSDTWLNGCIINSTSNCSTKPCSMAPTTLLTNDDCSAYRIGCATNDAGCLDSTAQCSAYQGSLTMCQTLTGSDGPCTNIITATSTTSCIVRTCLLNTTANSDVACESWLPTVNNVKNCVWNGTTGCIVATSNCSVFIGTIDSCATFTAANGPCSGEDQTNSNCFSNDTICNKAPVSYTTDTQCKAWHDLCMTNGFGCFLQSTAKCFDIVSATVCPFYKSILSCDFAQICSTKPNQCSGFTTAYDCNNVFLSGKVPTCGWNGASCVNLTCALLSNTYTTETACSTALQGCTTIGAGCVSKGPCSTYNKQACGIAATDASKLCIWSNSTCRQIVCSDNASATSDTDCSAYLVGCRTSGIGCSSELTCSQFKSAVYCLSDSLKSPCLWHKQTCVNYTKCEDILGMTHSDCQAVSPLCTTNGTNCLAILRCAYTILQASCILGTDGNCGWLPASGNTMAQCQLYTNCVAATGRTTDQCQSWGSQCVTNGTRCIAKSTCSSYVTQTACSNAGTDGPCQYTTGTASNCRLRQCSDANANLMTYDECSAFSAATQCTISGTACIPLSTCNFYSMKESCIQGIDGVCIWDSSCRLKACKDLISTTNSQCSTAIAGFQCVSNGVNCIVKTTCSFYQNLTSCLGGGIDGLCAFTPGTSSSIGTCALFSSCSSANQDQVACQSRSDACYWSSGTNTSCDPHTCLTKSLGSQCLSIPSFNLLTFTICFLSENTCIIGSPSSLTQSTCFSQSQQTYTWNPSTNVCQQCMATTNSTVTTSSNIYGNLMRILVIVLLE